jgi:hypothetical protein
MPAAWTRLHAALLRYLPSIINGLRRLHRCINDDGTRFAP